MNNHTNHTEANAEPQNIQQLSELINNPFFYSPSTLEEAYDNFFAAMERINDADRAVAMGAALGLVNAIAAQIKELGEK